MTGIFAVAIFTFVFAMNAERLSRTILTAPIVFISVGILCAQVNIVDAHRAENLLHIVAEFALVVLLFLDASKIDVMSLRSQRSWPVRMLALGLPLSMLLGTAIIWMILPDWPLASVALVAAILAPTDAALGQAVVTNPDVPLTERQSLTVESGLNDGLALPAVLLFASLSAVGMGEADTNWLTFTVKQLLLGPAVGAALGLFGGRLLLWAKETGATSDAFSGVGSLALAGAAYLAADAVGGNGFIAAFVAGLCFGSVVGDKCHFATEFTENEGQLLSWASFFLLGLVLVPDAMAHLDLTILAVILSSLFIVRPLAIYLSLMGSSAPPITRLFFGWFGPRGLATALFALLVVGQIDHTLSEPVLHIAINAVWISALLHGISAIPAAKRYGALMANITTKTSLGDTDEQN